MGAFNVLRCVSPCPACRETTDFEIQFKYGEMWLYEYRIGDELRWSARKRINIGKPEYRRVVVDGAGNPCKRCGTTEINFDIFIEFGKIVSVAPHSPEYDFVHSADDFIVLEET